MNKTRIEDLAMFGGDPLFPKILHVGRPNIGERGEFFKRVNDILDKKWLSNHGTYVDELEKRLAEFLEARHCILISNGTIALEIAARALGLSGEVIVPSFTFIASAHALDWLGLKPVFVDVDPMTHNLDPLAVEAAITEATSGILGVHVWGRACDTRALEEIARRHRLQLFYDASHAFGCSQDGRMIGNFGGCEIFSFHATKVFNTFEGGCISTNDDDLAAKIRLMKNFGFVEMDVVASMGTNGKLNEVSAAMGLTNLDSFDRFVASNERNYKAYLDVFAPLPGMELCTFDQTEKNNYQYVVVDVKSDFPLTRDQLVQLLHAENVRVRRYFWPGCHRQPPYRDRAPDLSLPNAEGLANRLLVFPTSGNVDEAQIRSIGTLLQFVRQLALESGIPSTSFQG